METEGECGCKFHISHDPCEQHRKAMEAGKEHAHIRIEFRDRHSDWPANRHRVNLERVQRIELGLDSEPMPFNETTLADMLQGIADAEPTGNAAFALTALANALRGTDPHHALKLKQKRPGKWQSPTDAEIQWNREASWLWTLGAWEREGMKTEAAIAKIAELEGVSRATVFAGVRSAEQWLELAWSVFQSEDSEVERPEHLTKPRPIKKPEG